VAAVWAVCLGLTVACGGAAEDTGGEQQSASGAPAGAAGPSRPVEVSGCLTARGDRYVLTDLERADEQGGGGGGQAATESYELVGNTENLKQHVGKQVRVVGEAEPQQVAEVRESSPAPATSGATGTTGRQPQGGQQPSGSGQPQVSTATETRMEVAKLRVQSVTPSGATCAAEAK
jgi:hypothetical protein